jgi:hypothetical protein
MQSRRRFFGQIGALIAASAAPSIFLPSSPVGWKRNIIYQPVRLKLKATWCPELLQDLQAYHNINAESELDALIKYAAETEFPENELVRIEKGGHEERIYQPSNFTVRYPLYAVMMERV